ncbi:hypothetical protein Tco_0450972 [Tanacetum coccineum]
MFRGCARRSDFRSWDYRPLPKRTKYGWTETREAHVYKVEAKETDQVNVYPGIGRGIQITVTLKKEENAPTRGYMYMD